MELLKILPQLLWFALATVVMWLVIVPVVRAMDRGQGVEFSVSQVTLKVVERRLTDANFKGPRIAQAHLQIGPVADRVERSGRTLGGASILWIDDSHPLQNVDERHALNALGVAVDIATNLEEAEELLRLGLGYDVIISDLNREGQEPVPCLPGSPASSRPGCALIERMRQWCREVSIPIIFYTGNPDELGATPAGVFGMTNRPDQLFMLILDALERRPQRDLVESDRRDKGASNFVSCRQTPIETEHRAAEDGNHQAAAPSSAT